MKMHLITVNNPVADYMEFQLLFLKKFMTFPPKSYQTNIKKKFLIYSLIRILIKHNPIPPPPPSPCKSKSPS